MKQNKVRDLDKLILSSDILDMKKNILIIFPIS